MSDAPRPGSELHLAEDDYKFGVGPLICRVRAVITPVVFDDETWWHVRGDCANGTARNHGGWVETHSRHTVGHCAYPGRGSVRTTIAHTIDEDLTVR